MVVFGALTNFGDAIPISILCAGKLGAGVGEFSVASFRRKVASGGRNRVFPCYHHSKTIREFFGFSRASLGPLGCLSVFPQFKSSFLPVSVTSRNHSVPFGTPPAMGDCLRRFSIERRKTEQIYLTISVSHSLERSCLHAQDALEIGTEISPSCRAYFSRHQLPIRKLSHSCLGIMH